jgi:hypothetical protein
MGKSCNTAIFVRPSKREEMLSKQPSEQKAFDVAEEWAAKIVELGIEDRFGVEMRPIGRWHWGVYLIDRSKPEDAKTKSKGKKR